MEKTSDNICERRLGLFLLLGILIRFVVFLGQNPLGNDGHDQYLYYILRMHRLPPSDAMMAGYQPPLYYILAAIVLYFTDIKGAQFLSFLFSAANIVLMYLFIRRTSLVKTNFGRMNALLLPIFAPQFILMSNLVSNDTLAYLLGTMVTIALMSMIEDRSDSKIVSLALLLGAGLLTRHVFLFLMPTVVVMLAMLLRKRGENSFITASVITAFLIVTAIVGGYKFVQNFMNFGRMLVVNIELWPAACLDQVIPVSRLRAFADFNFIKLLLHPGWSREMSGAPFLLFYNFFWSNDSGILMRPILVLSLFPTALVAMALPRPLINAAKALRASAILQLDTADLQKLAMVLLTASNFLMVVLFGLRYNLFTCFQGRYMFPVMLPISVLFAVTLDRFALKKSWKIGASAVLTGLYTCFLGALLVSR